MGWDGRKKRRGYGTHDCGCIVRAFFFLLWRWRWIWFALVVDCVAGFSDRARARIELRWGLSVDGQRGLAVWVKEGLSGDRSWIDNPMCMFYSS